MKKSIEKKIIKYLKVKKFDDVWNMSANIKECPCKILRIAKEAGLRVVDMKTTTIISGRA